MGASRAVGGARMPRQNEGVRSAEDESRSALSDPGRLDALRRAELVDTPPEEAFDRLTELARTLMRAPVALISLVEPNRQFFKSQQGLPEPYASRRETPLSHSFCQHVVAGGEALVVSDARENAMLCANGAVRDLNVVAYLGVPLRDPEGHVLGSLCVIDGVARVWNEADVAALAELSKSVMTEIFLRQVLRRQMQVEAELRASEARNRLLLQELRHRVSNALAVVRSVVRQSLRSARTVEQAAEAIEGRLSALGRGHDLLSSQRAATGSLRALVEASLDPFRGDGAFRLEGEEVDLPPNLALMFSMALHELATNAAKYGALTAPSGRVDVAWRLRRSEDEAPRVDLTWTERGGPPVRPPRRSGFGSQLIRRSAGAENAQVSIDFAEDGVQCRISAPLGASLPRPPAQPSAPGHC
jgi:two-component sensor histidine kinase